MPKFVKKPERKPYQRRHISTQGIRLDKLSYGTLRRYQYFFGVGKDQPYIEHPEALLEAVEEHFTTKLEVNPVDVIYRFLSTKKDPDQGTNPDNYFLRATRAYRANTGGRREWFNV